MLTSKVMFLGMLMVAATHLEVLMGKARGTENLHHEAELARTINIKLDDPNQAVWKSISHDLLTLPLEADEVAPDQRFNDHSSDVSCSLRSISRTHPTARSPHEGITDDGGNEGWTHKAWIEGSTSK